MQFGVGINRVEDEKSQLLFTILKLWYWSLALILCRIAFPTNSNKLYCSCLFLELENKKKIVSENVIYVYAQAGERNIKYKHVLDKICLCTVRYRSRFVRM